MEVVEMEAQMDDDGDVRGDEVVLRLGDEVDHGGMVVGDA